MLIGKLHSWVDGRGQYMRGNCTERHWLWHCKMKPNKQGRPPTKPFKGVHILFLTNHWCPQDYDLVVAIIVLVRRNFYSSVQISSPFYTDWIYFASRPWPFYCAIAPHLGVDGPQVYHQLDPALQLTDAANQCIRRSAFKTQNISD